MAAFVYRAVDPQGKVTRGVIDAEGPRQARQALRERRLLPLSVDSTAKGSRGAKRVRGHITAAELGFVTRQLATLAEGDVRIEDGLRIIASQAGSHTVSSVLLDVRARILTGQSFPAALSGHPASFPEFYRASISAGVQSGQLAPVLLQLAALIEKRRKTARKVQLALLYPILLTVVSTVIITLLLIYVVPDIVRVFVARGQQLPFLTRALIGLSQAATAWGLPFVIALAVCGIGLQRWSVRAASRLTIDRQMLRTPAVGGFVRAL